MNESWQATLDAQPILASYLGESNNKDRLGRLDEQSHRDTANRLGRTLNALEEVDYQGLSEHNKVNYDVFRWMVQHERRQLDFNGRFLTFNTVVGWQTLFAQIAASTTFTTEQDYRDYTARLGDFGRYADENIELMRKGIETGYVQPCETLDGYEANISGFISANADTSLFFGPFRAIPDKYHDNVRSDLEERGRHAIETVVIPAYERYLKFYQNEYLPACRSDVGLSSIPGGQEYYEFLVDYFTTIDTDANTVHELGLAEVRRIEQEMESLIEKIGFDGDTAAFAEFLRSNPDFYTEDSDDFMRRIAAIAKKADGLLPQFFAYIPRSQYSLIQVPAAIAPKTPAAFYQPGAADLTRAGLFFVNVHDVGKRPLYELTALTAHEAVPGHHLQISVAQELTDLPKFRQQYYFYAYGEGWGLYAEQLALEMGLYETDYDRYGQLIFEMWRACRLVVDTGIHSKNWSRKRAIEFMIKHTALSAEAITTEVDRYITLPGQALAYKVGERELLRLRGRAEERLGSAFSLRDFHALILTTGAVPLDVLAEVVEKWIDEKLDVPD